MTGEHQAGAHAAQKSRGVGCLRGVRAVRMLGRSELCPPDRGSPSSYKEAVAWKQAEPRDQEPRARGGRSSGPKLDALAAQVEVSNQTIKGAEARVRQARALTQQARAALFPTVSANVGATRSAAVAARAHQQRR